MQGSWGSTETPFENICSMEQRDPGATGIWLCAVGSDTNIETPWAKLPDNRNIHWWSACDDIVFLTQHCIYFCIKSMRWPMISELKEWICESDEEGVSHCVIEFSPKHNINCAKRSLRSEVLKLIVCLCVCVCSAKQWFLLLGYASVRSQSPRIVSGGPFVRRFFQNRKKCPKTWFTPALRTLAGPSFGPLFGHFFWTILNFSPKAIRASRLRAVV